MFWAAVLPFQITCVLIVAGYTAFVVWAPKFKMKRGHAAALGVPLATFGFIPLCLGVDALLSPFRFGVFEYDSPAEMGDGHADRRLPPAARSLTVEQTSVGFKARFEIGPDELEEWMDEQWALAAKYRPELYGEGRERTPPVPGDPAEFARWFGELGWLMPPDAIYQQEPIPVPGGGSGLWYSPSEGRAYQRVGYW